MKDTLHEFLEMLKLDRQNSAWAKQNTLESRFAELKSEIAEIEQALNKKDMQNLKEELGDALLDLMTLMVIAEDQGHFKAEEAIKEIITKIKRRKPWIFNGEKLTAEQEVERWKEAKKREKATTIK